MRKRTIILTAVLLACCALAQWSAKPVVQVQSRWTPARLNPLAWWKLDGNLTDSGPSNFATTINGTESYTNIVNGQALVCNPTTHATAGDILDFDLRNPYTVTCWFTTTATNIALQGLAARGDNTYVLTLVNNKLAAYRYDTAWRIATCNTPIVPDTLYFGAMTYDGTNVTAWLNGSASAPTASTGNMYASETLPLRVFRMGRYGNIVAGNLHGNLDDVLVFDRALTAAEITQIYQWRQ